MGINRDLALAKRMARHPTRAYWLTRSDAGVGAELRDLRASLDDVAFGIEQGNLPKLLCTDLVGPLSVKVGAAGAKLYVPALLDGYEKAAYRWTYSVGKQLIITAVKPGELGNRIKIVFASDPADAVTSDGNVITIKIDNDGATVPADLQTLVAADRKISQLIAITSTDATAIPDAFALAGPSGYLVGGTGLSWGGYVSSTWEANTGILFKATKPGAAAAKYQLEFQTGNAVATPTITATRKKCIIKYKAATTTCAEVVTAVNADGVAKEHVRAMATAGGAGNFAETNLKVVELGEDQGTVVFVDTFQAEVVEIAATYVKVNIVAASSVRQPVLANVRLLYGLIDHGSIPVLTAA